MVGGYHSMRNCCSTGKVENHCDRGNEASSYSTQGAVSLSSSRWRLEADISGGWWKRVDSGCKPPCSSSELLVFEQPFWKRVFSQLSFSEKALTEVQTNNSLQLIVNHTQLPREINHHRKGDVWSLWETTRNLSLSQDANHYFIKCEQPAWVGLPMVYLSVSIPRGSQ